jgi:Protein of unknown function (DUF2493).
MKVIIAGGRDYRPTRCAWFWLRDMLLSLKCTEVVSGKASGADAMGEKIAERMGFPLKSFPADWNKYGKAAGPMRNEQMAQYADACILFPGGSGTENMKSRAIAHGLKVIEYKE